MRKRNNRGFTMAELLIVVAIIGVLGGISFIAVQSHQRSLAQLERDTIAKEIYFAAQNHLTMAESQGLLKGDETEVNSSFYGNEETSDDREDTGITVNVGDSRIFYAVANGGDSFQKTAILDLMLPFGAIDETVRAGGFYIIRYQANPAIVLDVFYCSRSGKPEKYNYQGAVVDYNAFLKCRNRPQNKLPYPNGDCVVGWYGGAEPGRTGDYLETPSLTVTNGEKLIVTVKNPNNSVDGAQIMLMVKGVTSNAQAAFELKPTANHRVERSSLLDPLSETSDETSETMFKTAEYTVILDDISKHYDKPDVGWHFADLNGIPEVLGSDVTVTPGTSFKPGEDIVVVAVAYSNSRFMNIAYSNEVTTNSLYADLIKETTGEKDPSTDEDIIKSTAIISCIRHLENLDKSLSGWEVGLTDARQVENLDWSKFIEEISDIEEIPDVSVCKAGDTGVYKSGTKPGCYLPVNPGDNVALTYDGNHHAISNIAVDTTDDANPLEIDAGGVFGALNDGSCVKNLEIKDIKVTLSSGKAGALAGKLTQSTALETGQFNVSNVVAYVAYNTDYETAFISTGTGNAGGLIGETVGVCGIEKSAAAVGVSSAGGDAGGLIGKMERGTVTACYSGGHTINDTRTGSDAVVYDPAKPNVKASGTGDVAGGLIGDAGAAAISNSYSTCSVEGATAGGLVGSATGDISNSYATGLVAGKTNAGAFAGTYSPDSEKECSDCRYFEIINEQGDGSAGYTYLGAVGKGPDSGITALDETAVDYDAFSPPEWQVAAPYNATLGTYYDDKYPLKTVEQLSTSLSDDDTTEYYVATHYGDWPAPEIFVINAKDATS